MRNISDARVTTLLNRIVYMGIHRFCLFQQGWHPSAGWHNVCGLSFGRQNRDDIQGGHQVEISLWESGAQAASCCRQYTYLYVASRYKKLQTFYDGHTLSGRRPTIDSAHIASNHSPCVGSMKHLIASDIQFSESVAAVGIQQVTYQMSTARQHM